MVSRHPLVVIKEASLHKKKEIDKKYAEFERYFSAYISCYTNARKTRCTELATASRLTTSWRNCSNAARRFSTKRKTDKAIFWEIFLLKFGVTFERWPLDGRAGSCEEYIIDSVIPQTAKWCANSFDIIDWI